MHSVKTTNNKNRYKKERIAISVCWKRYIVESFIPKSSLDSINEMQNVRPSLFMINIIAQTDKLIYVSKGVE